MNSQAKSLLFLLLFFACSLPAIGQTTGNFTVNGDIDKYYPVVFDDGGWNYNTASELEIGRSNVHRDGAGLWRGSLIAKFRYHTTAWGNGSEFIEADMRQYVNLNYNPKDYLIAGWRDVTYGNGTRQIVIWIRGNTSYSFTSRYPVTPQVYDGVTNPLPFQEVGGAQHSYKTTADSYVNTQGKSSGPTYFSGYKLWTSYNWGQAVKLPKGQALEFDAGITKFGMGASSDNFFYLFSTGVEDQSQPPTYRMIMNNNGELGIGLVPVAGYKLLVDGTIGARRIKVTQGAWADFVFHEDYQLPSLQEVEKFIKTNKHLPDIPSEKEVAENGIDVGEMNKKLLQKIEEMTLHMINMEKRIQELESNQQKKN